MVDVTVASQLQQWSFEKTATRPERCSSDSSASSPNLCDDTTETLRIDTTSPERRSPPPRKESIALQERYMSSEEDLSPADDGSDSEYDYDDVVIHDPAKECKARTMSISRWSKGKSCDMAVTVSYAFVGRPKVVELQDCKSPTTEAPTIQKRSASLANIPITPITLLRKAEAAQRLSMKVEPTTTRSISPPAELNTRRPSTSHSPTTEAPSSLHLTESASTTSSFRTAPSNRSISPAVDDILARPVTAIVDAHASARSSVYVSSQVRNGLERAQTTQSSFRQSQWAPLTPASPATHAFLSSDPYETSSIHSASPIIKPAPHRRLRSISMKLALAKIAITPSKKTYDSRIDGKMPNTPSTPLTPQTAPIQGSSSFASPNRLRRASTILRPRSRHGETSRGPSPETAPPVPSINMSNVALNRLSRMQARGANEREPTLVLPPCPSDTDEDPMSSFKSKKIRKRKSLMSLMDAL
ncbi:hypothetical protein CC86DRAFT_369936 [Ophiobolus disseminans]|uniref:Uncharacterized protein n=1 Tax=Ophiobolus disseminans TaxID=1469910 RepID=A0A6A7A0I9_9PLEO|nr:hypothetical protein CC86DRAFT_369936 [Ophiobolus disseminans]